MSMQFKGLKIAMVAVLAFGLAGVPVVAGAEEVSKPKRVIYLLLDTLGAKHLHYMGYERETSPFLDSIAATSTNFRFCISHGDGTVYAMPAVFASKYYSQLYLDPPFVAGLPPSVVTLPELFQEGGFYTLGYSTNPHISTRTRYHQGFDDFYDMFPVGAVYSRIEQVIRKVRRTYRPTGGNEFIYIQLMDIHGPYNPPSPYHRMWGKPYDRSEFKDGRMTNREGYESIGIDPYWGESHDVQQADIDHAISQYDGEIRYLDDHLPELLKALRYDEDEDMLVITSDHGEQFYENGFLGHNRSNSMAEIHVPLLIRHPELAPREVETPVGVKDIYTTLCDIYGFEVPQDAMGRSLLPAMLGETLAAEPLFSEAEPKRGPTGLVLHDGLYYYLSTEAHRYMRPWLRWPIREVLFDYQADPTLQKDLLAERPEDRAAMNALLRSLTPRFEHAVIENVDGSEDDIVYGETLVAVAEDDGVLVFSPELREHEIGLSENVKVDHPLLLEFSYTLEGGPLRIESIAQSKSRAHYNYRFHKKRNALRAFQAVVFPDGESVRLRFRLEGDGGAATIEHLRLRPMEVPRIPVVPWEGGEETFDVDREALSEEDIERMEALGYLQ